MILILWKASLSIYICERLQAISRCYLKKPNKQRHHVLEYWPKLTIMLLISEGAYKTLHILFVQFSVVL
ncbi:uncharacterized protein OCT59_007826 [Rhizophagus irregularis]|uniref:uncharacterized protein n=1 Tax=Rhizophagus irregularis TaxID=588596 RepID=UPI001C1ABAC9|nr:hypothetical protein OCT59_007826 [Rhizophagus irregularis]CAB4493793.1 unnamed protein product [Rhizophagus irregularis]